MKIAVSYLKSKYDNDTTINLLEKTSADYIHVDLMDGIFVPQKNFQLKDIITLLKNRKKPLDIHLMVLDPIKYIDELAKLKPEYITFHLEATKNVLETIEKIKKYNLKVGLTLKPNTDIYELMPYLSIIDLVLIMSVNPGLGGQEFITDSINRLDELQKIRQDNNLNFEIEMDGGLNATTIKLVSSLDIAVSGSYICMYDDYQHQINSLLNK